MMVDLFAVTCDDAWLPYHSLREADAFARHLNAGHGECRRDHMVTFYKVPATWSVPTTTLSADSPEVARLTPCVTEVYCPTHDLSECWLHHNR